MLPAINLQIQYLRYQQQLLFNNLSLTIVAGHCTCILGPSGTGKSTLLRLLANLPTDAIVSQFTCTTHDEQPLAGRIAYLAQQDALFPWLTVLENVLISKRLSGQSKIDINSAKLLLQTVGLSDALTKKPAQLSGGMRQRAALARALFEDKTIILLDEPFAAIDAVNRWRLQALTVQLLHEKTLVWVTHDPIEALRIGHHIKILGHNRWIGMIDLPTPLPRDLNHPQFIEWHTKLLNYLQQAM